VDGSKSSTPWTHTSHANNMQVWNTLKSPQLQVTRT